jgi:hypothetical protein
MTMLHHLFVTPWVSLPFDLARGFTGRSQIPIYELDRRTVTTPHARVRPLGVAQDSIRTSAWRLAHAIKKADCARGFSPLWLYVGAAGFVIEHLYLFKWDPKNLRLASGMADAYADSTRTSLAGRIAQGMTILFMEERGYAFVDRFGSFLRRASEQMRPGTRAARRRQGRTPDFVFEKHSQGSAPPERALAESKGGFVSPGRNPDIKSDLAEALNQLDDWGEDLDPPINKSFAVGTFLREVDDDSHEPSLIAFVDPEPGESQGTIEYRPDAIRRANYAAWLTGMGFSEAAQRLLGRPEAEATRLRLPVVRLGNRKYAISVAAVRPKLTRDTVLDDEFWTMLEDWPFWLRPIFRRGFAVQIMGLELGVLRTLAETTTAGNWRRLMALEPVVERESFPDVDAGNFTGSIFRDGTMLGDLHVPSGSRPRLEVEEVTL